MKQVQFNLKKRLGIFAVLMLVLVAVFTVASGGLTGLLMVASGAILAVAPIALTDKEQAIVDKMKADLQAEAEKLGKGYIKADEFTATFNNMFLDAMGKFDFNASKIKQITDAVEATLNKHDLSANPAFLAVQQKIEAMEQEKPQSTGKRKTLIEALTAVKDDIKKVTQGLKGEVFLDINAANTLRSSVSDNDYSQNLPEIGQLAIRKLPMRSLCRAIQMTGDDNNGVIRYVDWDEGTTVRAAAMRDEGAQFPESTAKWKQYTRELKKIGDTLPVSEELMEDMQSLAAELQLFLENNLQIKEDSQLLTGDGTGDNIKGLIASVSEFPFADYANTIQDASEYDLMVKVVEDITKTGGNKYAPDFAVMPSSLITKMMLKKDDNNNYVLPPFMVKNAEGQMVVANVRVIEENGFSDSNQLVIGDSRYMRLYYKAGILISKGFIDKQFAEDLITLKAKMRELFLIREADAGGFRKVTDVSTAIAALNTNLG